MIWLSLQQLKGMGVSKGILHRNRANWKWRGTGVRGRNGKFVEEVLLESMQAAWQQKYLGSLRAEAEERENHPVTEAVPPLALHEGSFEEGSLTTEFSAGDLVGSPAIRAVETRSDGGRRLVEAIARYEPGVRDALLAEARRLSSIVEAYDALTPKRFTNPATGKREYSPEAISLAKETACTDPLVLSREPARAKAKSPHTLEMWSKAYGRGEGLAVFLRKPPVQLKPIDKRLAPFSAEAREWVINNWKRFPSPTHLYKNLKKQATAKGWVIPSRGYIWRNYRDMPPVVKTLRFEGEKAYQAKLAPFVPRTVEDLEALQLLCGDHSVRDVSVILPSGELTRPWLTLWLDLRTYLIWGWHLDLTPSSNTIGLAYVNGVQNFGAQPMFPAGSDTFSWLYTDQGKDYRCKTLTGKQLLFEKAARMTGTGMEIVSTQYDVGFMKEMGLRHLLARGYNAKEKPVERVHKDISAWEQNTFQQEYCGKDTSHRPERWRDAWARHERLKKKVGKNVAWLIEESPFMTLDDYRDNLAGWIHDHNTSEHTRTVLRGANTIPVREYERLYTTPYEISNDALALMLMKADKRKLGKNGIQMFQTGWRYGHEDFSEFKGRDIEIEVRYTEGDYSRIWAVLPATTQKPSQVVEATLITPSSILRPNKQTMEQVARMKAHERKMDKEYHLLSQSRWRGESTEDRFAAGIEEPDDFTPEAERIAVNAQPRVIALSRFDRPKLAGAGKSSVTAEQIESANVIEGMFGEDRKETRIKEPWED